MSGLFQGRVQNRIDSKGRVSVPAGFRRVLEQGDDDTQAGNNARMSVLHWPGKKSLEVYSVNGMEELAKTIHQYKPRSPMREMLSYFLGGGSQTLQLDDTGRVVLSEVLRSQVGIAEDVVFVGTLDKFEIWEPEAEEAARVAKLAKFAEMADLDDPFADMNWE